MIRSPQPWRAPSYVAAGWIMARLAVGLDRSLITLESRYRYPLAMCTCIIASKVPLRMEQRQCSGLQCYPNMDATTIQAGDPVTEDKQNGRKDRSRAFTEISVQTIFGVTLYLPFTRK